MIDVRQKSVAADDGAELSYRVIGTGARAIYLVHGWSVSGAVFDELLPLLDVEGRKLVVPDLRGSGRSAKPATGYNTDRYLEDLIAVADHERDAAFTAIGHSMGGQIVQGLLANAAKRVDAAILLTPVPATGLALPDPFRALFAAAANDRSARERIIRAVTKELSEEKLKKMLADGDNVRGECVAEAFTSWSKGTTAWSFEHVKSPVLIVSTDDPAMPLSVLREAVASRIPGARIAYLPGPGHYPQVERPNETAAIVAAFLAAR